LICKWLSEFCFFGFENTNKIENVGSNIFEVKTQEFNNMRFWFNTKTKSGGLILNLESFIARKQ